MSERVVERREGADYLAGVRAALSDLPATEVAEILDDVGAHLDELAADGESGALTDRLGPPEAYAAELRAAAGYPPAPTAAVARGAGAAQLALAALVGSTVLAAVAATGMFLGGPLGVGTSLFALLLAAVVAAAAVPALLRGGPGVADVAGLPSVRRLTASWSAASAGPVAGYLVSLQPAWWLVRAVAAAWLVAAVVGVRGVEAVLVVALVAVPGSVWVGHRSRRDRRWLWAVVPLNALAVVVVLGALLDAFGADPTPVDDAAYYPGLWQDGSPVQDVRPVDAQGVPLTGIYLFDQDGRPLDVPYAGCDDTGDPSGGVAGEVAPYPRGTVTYDSSGRCVVVPPGPLVVAVPTAPAPTATPVPTATPTPTVQAPPTG